MWSWFSCHKFYLHSALGRLSTVFIVQILGRIIKILLIWVFFQQICVSFFRFYSWNSQLMTKIGIFYGWVKPKKWIKSKKYADFGHKLGKFVSNLKMNITKMGKMKSGKFMIIFAFSPDFKENYHKFFGF